MTGDNTALDRIARNYKQAFLYAVRQADLAERPDTVERAIVNAEEADLYLKQAIEQLITKARIDELERTRRYDDMDDSDKHIEVEILIVARISELKAQLNG